MNKRPRWKALHAIVAASAATLSMHDARADQVFAQSPCSSYDICVYFDHQVDALTVRSFKFTLPGPGKAIVTFNGSISCSNPSFDPPKFGRIDLSAQIVANDTDEPDHTGPGGSRFLMSLPPGDGVSFDVTMPINLAATRVLNISAAGSKRVSLKLKRNHMTAGLYCTVLSGSFVVQYVP